MTTALLPPHQRDEAPVRPVAADRARWRWPARLVFAAAAAWTVFVLAFLLFTGEHWWWRVAELMPPLTFVAVPLVLAALAPLARPVRWRVLAAAIGTLIVGVYLSGLGLPAGSSAAPAGAVRVFSWNTEYWADSDDPERFYAYLAAQDADVYLLQEHVSWDVPGHRPIRADHRAELARRFPGYQVVAVGELLTMSRLPITGSLAVDSLPHLDDPVTGGPPAGSDFADYYRYKSLRTDVGVGERVLSLYNVHVPVQLDVSMDPGDGEFYRFIRAQHDRRQAMYRGLLADLDRNPQPRLVAGDLNATSAMGEVRQLGDRLRDARPHTGDVYSASWPDSRPIWRLDWAFTGGPVQVHEYRIVPGEGMSDHRGQTMTVSVVD